MRKLVTLIFYLLFNCKRLEVLGLYGNRSEENCLLVLAIFQLNWKFLILDLINFMVTSQLLLETLISYVHLDWTETTLVVAFLMKLGGSRI